MLDESEDPDGDDCNNKYFRKTKFYNSEQFTYKFSEKSEISIDGEAQPETTLLEIKI
jgi:hypothetical protein